MAVGKSGLRTPLMGEHVKVVGNEIVYEVAGVDPARKTVELETVTVAGARLEAVGWGRLCSLDEA